MLMEVKKELKSASLAVKYNIMREMLNPITFITNVTFMILNNASFIVQWIILYSIKDSIGGYSFSQVMLLWALSATTYGISHILFHNAYKMSDLITNGKLDSYIVQPKNILLNVITSSTSISALGDLIYGIIVTIIVGLSFKGWLLFILFSVLGAIILTNISIISGSTSFYITKGDMIQQNMNSMAIHFSTYPEGIFNKTVKTLFYTLLPIGYMVYLPIQIITEFNLLYTLIVIVITILTTILAFLFFNKGLKRYSSSNLMSARI